MMTTQRTTQSVTWLGVTYDAAADFLKWTGPEATAVEKHYGCDLHELTGRQAIYGQIYVTIKRHVPTFRWDVLDALTVGEVMELVDVADVDEPAEAGEQQDPTTAEAS